MSPEETRTVTVRRLPDGKCHAASVRGLDGRSLRIVLETPAPAEPVDFKRRDLVEIAGPKTIFLGEVASLRGDALTIGLEHMLDLESLALLQQIWRDPEQT